MSFLLTHWKVLGWVLAVGAIAVFIHQRDARIRAQGRAEVYLQQADSLQAVADSFKVVARLADERADSIVNFAEERIMEAEVIIASIQENEDRQQSDTDSTVSMLRAIVPDEFAPLIDSLEVEIEQERLSAERAKVQYQAIIEQQDDIIASLNVQIEAKDQQIASLEQALAARVEAAVAMEQTQTGIFEKAMYAAGGFAVGYLLNQVGGF